MIEIVLSECHHPSRAKGFAFYGIPLLNRRGVFPEFEIPVYPIARLLRRRAGDKYSIFIMQSTLPHFLQLRFKLQGCMKMGKRKFYDMVFSVVW